MAAILVAYDIEDNQRRNGLHAYISSYLEHIVELSESCYVIDTTEATVEGLSSVLLKYAKDPKDKLYICTLDGKWDGFGPASTLAWLNDALGMAKASI